jgi:hypothetical protein
MKMILLAFTFLSFQAFAQEPVDPVGTQDASLVAPKVASSKKGNVKTIYPEGQTVDFEGLSLEGELKAPGEFYFQNRNQERFDSLTKRRLNFRREMMRDSIQSN